MNGPHYSAAGKSPPNRAYNGSLLANCAILLAGPAIVACYLAELRLQLYPVRQITLRCRMIIIDKFELWTTTNVLHFNTSECKYMYMVISRKRAEILPPPPTLKGQPNFNKLTTSSIWGSYYHQTCLGLHMLRTYATKLLGLLIGSTTN